MGAYINPPDTSKEAWLEEHGEPIEGPYSEFWSTIVQAISSPRVIPVCLVDNGPFTAAGIAYNVYEAADFLDPGDTRQKKWYLAPREAVYKNSNLENYLPQE